MKCVSQRCQTRSITTVSNCFVSKHCSAQLEFLFLESSVKWVRGLGSLNEEKTQLTIKFYDCSTTSNCEDEVYRPEKDQAVDVTKLWQEKVRDAAADAAASQ